MENKFVVGEFVVLRVLYSALYVVVLVTGEKLENGRWPCIINETGENVELREEQLFKIDWERKMESSPIERAVVALESIALSLQSIDAALHAEDMKPPLRSNRGRFYPFRQSGR